MKNENGNITLLGLLTSLIIICSTVTVFHHASTSTRLLQSRLETYLCFKNTLSNTQNYIKKMAWFNRAISAAFALTLVPQTSAQAKLVHQNLIRLQNIYHFSNLKKNMKPKHCTLAQSSLLFKKLPYQTKTAFLLKRNVDGSAEIRRHKWDFLVIEKNKYSLSSPHFVIRGELSLKNRYSEKAFIKSQELSLKVL